MLNVNLIVVKTSDNSQLFTFFANNTDLAMPGTVRFDRELGLYAKIIGGNRLSISYPQPSTLFVFSPRLLVQYHHSTSLDKGEFESVGELGCIT